VFEWDNFSKGTEGVLEACVEATAAGSIVIIGTNYFVMSCISFVAIC